MVVPFFFEKMNEAWPNAPSLQMDAWLLKTLTFEEKMISFFKMDEAWLNAPSLEMDAWFFWKSWFLKDDDDDDFFFFFWNGWGVAGCP